MMGGRKGADARGSPCGDLVGFGSMGIGVRLHIVVAVDGFGFGCGEIMGGVGMVSVFVFFS